MTRKTSSLAPIIVLLALLAVPVALYVTGYFWLSERTDATDRTGRIYGIDRCYKQDWAINLYRPAAWVETKLRGVDVELSGVEFVEDSFVPPP